MWEKRDRAARPQCPFDNRIFRCLVISPAGLVASRAPGGLAAGSEFFE